MATFNLSDAEMNALFGDAAEDVLPSGTQPYTGTTAAAPIPSPTPSTTPLELGPEAEPALPPNQPGISAERVDALFEQNETEAAAPQDKAPPPGSDIEILRTIADWRAKTFPQRKSREI